MFIDFKMSSTIDKKAISASDKMLHLKAYFTGETQKVVEDSYQILKTHMPGKFFRTGLEIHLL